MPRALGELMPIAKPQQNEGDLRPSCAGVWPYRAQDAGFGGAARRFILQEHQSRRVDLWHAASGVAEGRSPRTAKKMVPQPGNTEKGKGLFLCKV